MGFVGKLGKPQFSALAGLETGILLVDDIGPAAATDDAAVLVALFE
jgi:hypothetical protein